MQDNKKNTGKTGSNKSLTAEPGKPAQDEKVVAAHEEALADIDQDPDFSIHSPNDDLDEGETARLGEDKTDLV